jgi:hypothetical protein
LLCICSEPRKRIGLAVTVCGAAAGVHGLLATGAGEWGGCWFSILRLFELAPSVDTAGDAVSEFANRDQLLASGRNEGACECDDER